MLFSTKACVAGLVVSLAGGLAAPAAVAAPSHERRAVVAKATLTANRATVLSRQPVVLSGKVKPAKKGTVVVLQKLVRDTKKWETEVRLKTGRGGAFRYVDKPARGGVRRYRVVVPKTAKVKQGVSKPVKVTVYRWQSLAAVKVRAQTATSVVDQVMINAVRYGPGLVGYREYYREGFYDWNLNRACRELRTRIGNSDDSDTRAIANVSLVADGVPAYARSFGLAESEAITVDLTGILRLAFRWSSTNPDGTPENQTGASATLAEPQVLCAF